MTRKLATPNEKNIEMLFNRFMMQHIGLGKVALFNPSTRQEALDGYDAAISSGDYQRAICLQFKRCRILSKSLWKIDLRERQHGILHGFGEEQAFYVAAPFLSDKEFFKSQLEIQKPGDFLTNYFAVEASKIPLGANAVYFRWSPTGEVTLNDYWVKDEGKHRLASGTNSYCGRDLIDAFTANRIGGPLDRIKAVFIASPDNIGEETALKYQKGNLETNGLGTQVCLKKL